MDLRFWISGDSRSFRSGNFVEDSSKQSKFKTRSFLNICDHLNETNSVQRSEEEG